MLLHFLQILANNHMLWVDTIHDIIETSLGYMYCAAWSPLQITNVLDHPSTMHTEPLVIKPYTFPNPSCQAHLNPIPAINPQLNAPSPGQTHRTKFSGEDLEWLICLAVEKEPWAKPHSQVTKSWKAILNQLQLEGRFQTSSVTTIQNKLNALIAWQEVFSDFPTLVNTNIYY